MTQTLFFDRLLLSNRWVSNARICVNDGVISKIAANQRPMPGDDRHACGLPGMPNVHSHAFQRAIAGLTEIRGKSASDSFWTWRDLMYRFTGRMTPEDLTAIAAMAYAEMLESGFTRVGEFHYLHHDVDGKHYGNLASMSEAIASAADETGIGLTLLPVLYSYAGFGALPPTPLQARFVTNGADFARIVEGADKAVARLPDAIVGVAPHSLRAVSPRQIFEIASLGSDRPVHIHIAEQVGEVEDCLAWSGRRPVAWLVDNCDVDSRWCLVHATHVDQAEIGALAHSGAVVGLCPITEANLGDGIFPAKAYLDAGGAIGIGSDSNVRIDVSEELRLLEYGQRLASKSRNVLAALGQSTGLEIFRRTAEGGARALGVPGGIEEGLSADLISLNLHHPAFAITDEKTIVDTFIFAAGSVAIDCVWRRGRKVVANGCHEHRQKIVERYCKAITRLAA